MELEDSDIDFDYLFSVTDKISVYTGSAECAIVNGIRKIVFAKYPMPNLISRLVDYFFTLQHENLIDLFIQVFNEIYLQEVEYPKDLQTVATPTLRNEQRWNVMQFWNDAQRQHNQSMEQVFAQIQVEVHNQDDLLPAKYPNIPNKLG